MKKYLFPLFLLASGYWLVAALPAFAAATINISPAIPGTNPTAGTGTAPGAFIANFYQFALLIGGILAFGAIVYGGVLHAVSAGNPSRQSEGKQWIWSALTGLLLLGGAYIVIYTINPNLIYLNLPALQPLAIPSGGSPGGTGQGGSLSQADAQAQLAAAGISAVSSGNCSDKNNPSCTSLDGMQQSTVDELVALKNACGCNVTVTGGTEVGHAAGDLSHANGDKADIALNAQVTGYIQQNYPFIGTRVPGDGAPLYRDPATGAVYALEAGNNHWDITVPPR